MNANLTYHTMDRPLPGRRAWAGIVFLVFASVTIQAQFVQVNLNIPARTDIETLESTSMVYDTDPETGKMFLHGYFAFNISSVENIHVLVRLLSPMTLKNELMHPLTVSTALSYRNDGKTAPEYPEKHHYTGNQSTEIIFPLSNDRKLATFMAVPPPEYHAYVYIYMRTGFPAYPFSVYAGDFDIQIEFN